MVADARQKAGMPLDEDGMPLDEDGMPMRSYTNQSECIDNVSTKQKEAAMKNDKAKSNISKLTFVRSVWEEVLHQQKEEVIMAAQQCVRLGRYGSVSESGSRYLV